jgi:hypothetical protein
MREKIYKKSYKVIMRPWEYGQKSRIRTVDLPVDAYMRDKSDAARAEDVFKWGQNDFQPKNTPSVSVGDVVVLGKNKFAVVDSAGFLMVDKNNLRKYMKVAPLGREYLETKKDEGMLHDWHENVYKPWEAAGEDRNSHPERFNKWKFRKLGINVTNPKRPKRLELGVRSKKGNYAKAKRIGRLYGKVSRVR